MPAATCPTDDRLLEMLAGSLDPEATEALIDHVDGCESCQARVAALESGENPLGDQLAGIQELADQSDHSIPDWMRDTSAGSGPIALPTLELPKDIGPYRLTHKLAAGGMGTVYEARHRRLGRLFAMKLLRGERRLTRRQAERIRREWQTHGSLIHPNIVSATDAGIAEGMPYLVTEKIDGVDLSRLVKALGPLAAAEACGLVCEVARGLQYAHEQKVIHGDVKPSNLMLDRLGNVKVLDLGTARLRDENDDAPVLGTLAFMAPEQFEHPPRCGEPSDIYSLGCTLYFLLTGRTPFGHSKDKSREQLIYSHRHEAPGPLSEFGSEPSLLALQGLLDRMLAKEPEQRPTSMDALRDELLPFAETSHLRDLIARLPKESVAEESAVEPSFGLTSLLEASSRGSSARRSQGSRWRTLSAAAGALLLAVGAAAIYVSSRPSSEAASVAAEPSSPSKAGDPAAAPNRTERAFTWTGQPRQGDLDGLVLTPARFAGIDSWQIESIAPRGRVRCLRWSPDGTHLLTVSTDGHVRIYRWQGGLELIHLLCDRDHRFLSADWHPGGEAVHLISPSSLQRYDFAAGKVTAERAMKGMHQVLHHPTEPLVGVATDIGLLLFESESLERAGTEVEGVVTRFDWSPNGDRVALLNESFIQIFGLHSGRFNELPLVSSRTPLPVRDLKWTPDGNHVGVARSRNPDLLSADELKPVWRVRGKPELESIAFRRSDNKSAMGFRHTFAWYNGPQLVNDPRFEQQWGRAKVAWHPEGQCLAVGQDGLLRIFDLSKNLLARVGDGTAVDEAAGGQSVTYRILFRNNLQATFDRNGTVLKCRTTTEFDVGRWVVQRIHRDRRVSLQVLDSNGTNKLIWTSSDGVLRTAISPSRELVAVLTPKLRLDVVRVADSEVVHTKDLSNYPWIFHLDWKGNDALLLSGALNVEYRYAALYELGGDLTWDYREPHDLTAASAAILDEATYVQAGSSYQVRSSVTGELLKSVPVEKPYGRRHGVLYHRPGDDLFFSWGHDLAASYDSNASDAVICWNGRDITPRWSAINLGVDGILTLTPAGEVISSVGDPEAHLVWIVERNGLRSLHTLNEFESMIRSDSAP